MQPGHSHRPVGLLVSLTQPKWNHSPTKKKSGLILISFQSPATTITTNTNTIAIVIFHSGRRQTTGEDRAVQAGHGRARRDRKQEKRQWCIGESVGSGEGFFYYFPMHAKKRHPSTPDLPTSRSRLQTQIRKSVQTVGRLFVRLVYSALCVLFSVCAGVCVCVFCYYSCAVATALSQLPPTHDVPATGFSTWGQRLRESIFVEHPR